MITFQLFTIKLISPTGRTVLYYVLVGLPRLFMVRILKTWQHNYIISKTNADLRVTDDELSCTSQEKVPNKARLRF